jgi:tetratricopeptide (TPR) repeat protein
VLQYDSASIAYRNAIEVDSSCMHCKQRLAGVMSSKGMVKPAIKLYYQVLLFDSTNTIARSQLARLLKRESLFAEAIGHFTWMVEKDTLNSFLWEQIGDCASKLGNFPLTWQSYSTSFSLNSANMPLASKLIQLCIQSQLPTVIAHPIADRALDQDSTYIPIIRQKGYLYFMDENYRVAEKSFEKAYSYGDTSRFTMKFYGISLSNNGFYLKSSFFLEKAFAFDSTDRPLNYQLAKALIEVGERPRAIEILNLTERLIAPNPHELSFLFATRADAYNRGQNYQKAIEQYHKAIEFSPDQLEYLFEIALCHYQLKEFQKAKVVFNQYIDCILSDQHAESKKNRVGSANYFIKQIDKHLFFNDEQL